MTSQSLLYQWVSADSLLIKLGAPDSPLASVHAGTLVEALIDAAPNWLADASSGFGKALVVIRPGTEQALVERAIQQVLADLAVSNGVETAPIVVPVCYHRSVAPDLDAVAERCGLDPDEVIERHCSTVLSVLAIGFAPGFGYLGAIDERLRLPRRATPRTRVARGSVAIAEAQSVIYPIETPGGWHLIGQSPVQLIHYRPHPDTLFAVGRTVCFEPISLAQLQVLR
ncbi:5-oxoprolinase subunit B family protein [Litorivicinus lipolyticus]|uniref:5-oxoprolinase subunit B family protein n=1 Tax=Litorivicinus lipolyticus TaxID=418701 RepID=UPI003B59E88B